MESWYYMKMEVGDCLPRGGAIVYDDVEAIAFKFIFDYFGDCLHGTQHMIEFMLRYGEEIIIMFFCNYQGVTEVNRVNVEEGEYVIIIVQYFRMGFVCDYFTKDTFHVYKIRLNFNLSKDIFLNFSFERKVAKETLAAIKIL